MPLPKCMTPQGQGPSRVSSLAAVATLAIDRNDAKRSTAPMFVGVVLVAFTIAAFDPYRALLFSPILLGAPHALSDIWYLLVRDSGVPLRVRVALAAASGLILLNAGLVLFGWKVGQHVDSILLVSLLAIPMALVVPANKAVPQWATVAAFACVLLATSFPLRAVVAHLHNVIALIFLFTLAWPKWRKGGVALAVFVVVGLLVFGMALSFTNVAVFAKPIASPSWSPFLSLTFGAKNGVAGALLFSYGFLQLLHFAVWIGFIPLLKGDIEWKKVGRAFGFGLPILGVGVILFTVVAAPLSAMIDPLKAREAYLTLVSFHGWMEIAWLLAHSAQLMASKEFSLRKTFLFDAAGA